MYIKQLKLPVKYGGLNTPVSGPSPKLQSSRLKKEQEKEKKKKKNNPYTLNMNLQGQKK